MHSCEIKLIEIIQKIELRYTLGVVGGLLAVVVWAGNCIGTTELFFSAEVNLTADIKLDII